MADGSQVWVCKECGTENQPGEVPVADVAASAQAVVDQAAADTSAAAPAAPVADAQVVPPSPTTDPAMAGNMPAAPVVEPEQPAQ